ncbi:hypothetical protein SPRG_10783 [Saprolegnia parasitica CBS 223.65]|uniref:Ig-like domain-containing protein n=1 Tax=Saprolegnia parasitica (strain CBS 223.65) TaxID=695850 RepID=A0A067BZ83_SAPPC|nr:hypothetical protein SPRG_10783 [Saprolegnia parasitica CBS 223.65]KDO23588.1 hypothetical protein SPRG_10783 [Saprolegnia parasitica CBS 223.65]|eukprot:XP_012205736.1 hypothetical protein SPRG_10783 [Saprolegnia parasitica CBS 223.65]
MASVVLALLLGAAAADPYLVECFCNTTVTSQVSVMTSAESSTTTAVLTLPTCLGDVFGTTGIRWYVNGPFDAAVTYWPTKTVEYNGDRAAMRLIRLGWSTPKR